MRHSTPYVWRRGRVALNRRLVQAYQDIGISKTLLADWLEQVCPAGSLRHRILIARAYDNAHMTRTHLALPDITDLPDFTPME